MQLPGARLVANPGCYPTSRDSGLAAAGGSGLDRRGSAASSAIASPARSGAGKEPKRELHFVEVDENFRAYGLFTHRHTPEVTEHLGIGGERRMFSDAPAAAGARNSFDAVRVA